MQAGIAAVGEISPELVEGLVASMDVLAENLIKVLSGDMASDNFLLNVLFGGDKEAYEHFKYTFVLSASVMAESWAQILSKDDLSKALRLVADLMNGNGLDKDIMSAYAGFSRCVLTSGLMEDFQKRLQEKLLNRGGYFPVIDFQKGTDVISLKSIDPRLSSYQNGGTTDIIIKYIGDLNPNPYETIKVNNVPANKILDIRIPPGTDHMFDITRINPIAAQNGVTVIFNEF